MLVGEAPGKNEDLQGEPFVGAAGKLLDRALEQAGFRRANVYITNVLKCRPPQNRDPLPDEVEACAGYLNRQLELVDPKVVVILGRHAMASLLPGKGPITKVQGRAFRRLGRALVPTLHPAAVLRNSGWEPDFMRSFDTVRKLLDLIERGELRLEDAEA